MIEFWHWWVLAVVLGAVETVAPGAAFLWLGAAAALVGLALLAWPEMVWQIQFMIFGVLAIGAVVGARLIYRRSPAPDPALHLNRRAEQYLGTLHTLETPIVNGRGRAIVGDSHWTVEGPDLPAGTTVRVIGIDGIALRVEKAEPPVAAP
ncbi:NfeD family protein [Azospirillum halopraeferens]|uniref:NfeD family protein n=1 Tax=Azospirillum halopraeferens TaxID=34010 RepID=UPI000421B65B|nr:NfeD family protein [Azospirillum halopraeferens]